jgi:hypothetical protein
MRRAHRSAPKQWVSCRLFATRPRGGGRNNLPTTRPAATSGATYVVRWRSDPGAKSDARRQRSIAARAPTRYAAQRSHRPPWRNPPHGPPTSASSYSSRASFLNGSTPPATPTGSSDGLERTGKFIMLQKGSRASIFHCATANWKDEFFASVVRRNIHS